MKRWKQTLYILSDRIGHKGQSRKKKITSRKRNEIAKASRKKNRN